VTGSLKKAHYLLIVPAPPKPVAPTPKPADKKPTDARPKN
jgi:hypothetical protein